MPAAPRPDNASEPLAEPSNPDPGAGAAAIVESAAQLVAGSAGGAAGVVLPTVLSDVPVAILLIDLDRRTVTYANHSAVAMTASRSGEQGLPLAVDLWGAAAGLADLSGRPLADSSNPLFRLATGNPVSGEAVMAPAPVPGGPARTLWVTGFPLSPAGSEPQLALVVLLEVTTPRGVWEDPETAVQLLRDRAIIATDLAFTITDPRQEDNPLVWINPAFTRMTGYELEEVRGRNCRLLQGPATDATTVGELRSAIAEARPVTQTLLNYRKDGTAFWNQVAISPVFDGEDRLVSFVGVQTDVTERVRAQAEREQAYAAERAARHDAERARSRLALLAEASVRLGATLDVEETIRRLADLTVPAMADWVIIRLGDDQGNILRSVARHRDGREGLLQRYLEVADRSLTREAEVYRVLDNGEAGLVPEYDDTFIRRSLSDPEARRMAYELGTGSLMYVPLVARRRRVLGVMTFVAGPSGRRFTAEDLDIAAELGRRAGLTLDNARLYEREHRAAETLQRSLLPDLPSVPGLELAARYLAGDADADVGGDWYEVLPLPDGSVGLAVGDVVGHDLSAAAAMGHLRGLLRACAWNAIDDGNGDPTVVLERVDRLVQGLHVVPLATLLFGRLEPPAGPASDGWRLRYATAGHPPMVVRRAGGEVEILDDTRGILLGVTSSERESAAAALAPGDCLIGYTDGLIERRGEPLDVGLGRLAATLAADDGSDLDAVLDRLVAADDRDRSDDTAVLAVRILDA
ncbi:MAG: SpoIIE family protein phosphatase [Actinomycetota bacterium]|jgi:PAS domain S-box-containing protein|nr:SpoIIE family protein phosphatase [Actinomycetota bacterium]